MKLDSTRVNETIAFINNNANYPQIRRQAVAQFCRQQYPKLSLLDFGPYSNEFHTLSGEMSVKRHATVPAGNKNERAMRRAILLIWKALEKAAQAGAPPGAQPAMTMPAGNLDTALGDAILKASVYASPAAAADVFNTEVVANTQQFLAAHRVIVLGVSTGADRFSNPNSASFTNVLNFSFQYELGNDRFVFTGNPNPHIAAHVFATVSVPAVNWYDVPGNGGQQNPQRPGDFSRILGCELTGANFMLTTQFTGCAFCWTNQGGLLRAAHIGPTRAGYPAANLPTSYPGGGNGLAQRIIAQANPAAGMANAQGAALHVFGRGAGNAPAIGGGNPFYPNANLAWATIIGRNAGGWEFYLQAIQHGTNQISEARRIY